MMLKNLWNNSYQERVICPIWDDRSLSSVGCDTSESGVSSDKNFGYNSIMKALLCWENFVCICLRGYDHVIICMKEDVNKKRIAKSCIFWGNASWELDVIWAAFWCEILFRDFWICLCKAHDCYLWSLFIKLNLLPFPSWYSEAIILLACRWTLSGEPHKSLFLEWVLF